MKNLLFSIAVVLFISTQLKAQTKFIEVIATDSIQLKPVQFTYKISTSSTTSIVGKMSHPDAYSDEKESLTTSFIDVEKLMKQNNFSYELKDNMTYVLSEYSDSSFIVLLNSEAELKRLYALLAPLKGVSGRIVNVKFDQVQPDIEVYKRLYAKAIATANTLAQVSGNIVGKLISVETPKDLFSGLMELYKSTTNSFFTEVFGIDNMLTQRAEKKLLFKFEMK